MAFEKTKAAEQGRKSPEEAAEDTEVEETEETEETVEEETEETVEEKSEEATEEPEAVKAKEEVAEETVDYWKQRATTAETEKENYKTGLLNAKAEKRTVEKPNKEADVNEAVVMGVFERQNERKVLREVVNSKSPSYIPELVDDNQYNEIIGFLPRNLDKSTPEAILKALKVATKLWKEENGIQDKPKDKGKEAKAKLAEVKSSTASGTAPKTEAKKGERKLLKKSSSIENWY